MMNNEFIKLFLNKTICRSKLWKLVLTMILRSGIILKTYMQISIADCSEEAEAVFHYYGMQPLYFLRSILFWIL